MARVKWTKERAIGIMRRKGATPKYNSVGEVSEFQLAVGVDVGIKCWGALDFLQVPLVIVKGKTVLKVFTFYHRVKERIARELKEREVAIVS